MLSTAQRRPAKHAVEIAAPAFRPAGIRVAFVGQAGASAGGAERTLLTYLQNMPQDIDRSVILFEDGVFADEVRQLGIPVEIVAAPASFAKVTRERLRWDAAVASVEHALRVASRLRLLRVDLVYSNTMKAHVVCALAARFAGIPCVMHFHDLLEGSKLHALRLIARLGSVERVACAGIVAKAIDLKRTTVSYGPVVLEEYETLPDRNTARASLGLPADVPVVSIVGRINRWKGHDRFIRIAARVKAMRKDTHFAIIGSPIFRDADFVPELQQMVREFDLVGDVSFIPWVADVRQVYAATDVNVNCSTREPFGRSIPEAASAGVPSVCFDDGGAAETIVNRSVGRAIAAGDETAFAGAIVDLLETTLDPLVRSAVRHSARRFDARALSAQIALIVRRAARSAA